MLLLSWVSVQGLRGWMDGPPSTGRGCWPGRGQQGRHCGRHPSLPLLGSLLTVGPVTWVPLPRGSWDSVWLGDRL